MKTLLAARLASRFLMPPILAARLQHRAGGLARVPGAAAVAAVPPVAAAAVVESMAQLGRPYGSDACHLFLGSSGHCEAAADNRSAAKGV